MTSFSSKIPHILATIEPIVSATISEVPFPRGISINRDKTRHSSKRGTRRVTGITLGGDGKPYVGRHMKRKIRAMIHRFDSLDSKSRASLAGLIAYVGGFDPEFVNSLITKYGHGVVSTARRVVS